MENEENPNCGFPNVSHSPWKSLCDSHIPTAATTTAWKSGNPKAGFPLSHRGFSSPEEGRKEASSERETYSSFRLILGLENAARKALFRAGRAAAGSLFGKEWPQRIERALLFIPADVVAGARDMDDLAVF